MRNTLFTIKNNGLVFSVKVSSKAKKNCLGKIILDENNKPSLKVYTTAAPERGKANEAIITLLAGAWALRKNQIEILYGLQQRDKIIFLKGNATYLLQHLNKYIDLSSF